MFRKSQTLSGAAKVCTACRCPLQMFVCLLLMFTALRTLRDEFCCSGFEAECATAACRIVHSSQCFSPKVSAGTGGRCSCCLEQKTRSCGKGRRRVHENSGSFHRIQKKGPSPTPARLSFALAMVLTDEMAMNDLAAEHIMSSGVSISHCRRVHESDIDTKGSEPVMDAVCFAVDWSRVRQQGQIFRRMLCIGDTRESFSEKDDDIILHSHHFCRIVSDRKHGCITCVVDAVVSCTGSVGWSHF